jgi:hypothetical protein
MGAASLTHRVAYNRAMLGSFHVEMMHLALHETLSPRALKKMTRANVKQDGLRGQIGHTEYHFDNNAFEKSYAYIEEQRALTISSLMANDAPSAWTAFGRLAHTVQDFYAHSNYVELWRARQPQGAIPAPPEMDPVDPDVLHSPALRSGKIYFLEILTLIMPLRPLVMPFLPRDSHAWMNLDSPERGPGFKYAFHAATKRTNIEFEKTTKGLPADLFMLLVDK